MRITDTVHIVGSGQHGLSNALVCHVYLLDAGDERVLIDAGTGYEPVRILDVWQR